MCNKTVGFMSYTGKNLGIRSIYSLISFVLSFPFPSYFPSFYFYSCLAFFLSFLPSCLAVSFPYLFVSSFLPYY